MRTARDMFYRIRQALYIVPKDDRDKVKKEWISQNFIRANILSIILLVMNAALLIVDITVYRQRWGINIGYQNLFYAHIALAIERSIYIAASYFVKLRSKDYLYKLKNYMVIYSSIVILVWCSYLSINAQVLHGQISAFIIGSFSIASAILMFPIQSFSLLICNSAIFLYGLSLSSGDMGNFAANVINILFVTSFALIMSYINTSLYCRNYISSRTIQKQAKELEESRSKLEETVRKRTDELVKANEELIREMGIRHEIEMQSIRTKLMYEENQKLLSEFKEYEELRTVFFTNLSHELRTPLNVIFSAQQMTSFILRGCEHDSMKDKLERYNKIIKQNCYRLIRLIGNLIDITKIDANYFEIDKKNCDIVCLVENITQSVSEYIKDKNIQLNYSSTETEKIIACDPDKIERIILNLLSNAVKFTPEFGAINVRLYSEEKHVVIVVKDNGIGISEEMQNVIFDRFVQVDKSTTRNREGSGIGLSLVKSLVDLHQGSIALLSAPGKGSEFIVKLPDAAIPYELCIACTRDDRGQNIERINIEFSDIYS